MSSPNTAPITEPCGLYPLLAAFLIGNRICRGHGDFSRRFLKRSRSYWSTLDATSRRPSIAACLRLVGELEALSQSLTLKDATKVALTDFAAHVRADIAERVGGAS